MSSRKVLIAVDGSKQAEHAFSFYLKNVKTNNDDVIITHCVEFPIIPSHPMGAEMVQEVLSRSRADAERTALKFKEMLQTNQLKGKFVSEFGNPGPYIVERANKENVDMIIIGTRGMGTVRRTILGSVSDHVLHHAHCPVLVCRE